MMPSGAEVGGWLQDSSNSPGRDSHLRICHLNRRLDVDGRRMAIDIHINRKLDIGEGRMDSRRSGELGVWEPFLLAPLRSKLRGRRN